MKPKTIFQQRSEDLQRRIAKARFGQRIKTLPIAQTYMFDRECYSEEGAEIALALDEAERKGRIPRKWIKVQEGEGAYAHMGAVAPCEETLAARIALVREMVKARELSRAEADIRERESV